MKSHYKDFLFFIRYLDICLDQYIKFQKFKLCSRTVFLDTMCGSHSVMSDFVTPMDCNLPPNSSIHGILQAGLLKWIAIPFSEVIFLTQGSNLGLPDCRQTFYHLSHQWSPLYTVCSIHMNGLFIPLPGLPLLFSPSPLPTLGKIHRLTNTHICIMFYNIYIYKYI